LFFSFGDWVIPGVWGGGNDFLFLEGAGLVVGWAFGVGGKYFGGEG
jgi:hypothetical protein